MTYTNIAFPFKSITNDVIVEFFNPIITPNPKNIYKCNLGLPNYTFDLAYNSWNTVPIFHYSEGVNGTRKHADWPTGRPNTFDKDAYWDVELKMKDYAVLKILEMV